MKVSLGCTEVGSDRYDFDTGSESVSRATFREGSKSVLIRGLGLDFYVGRKYVVEISEADDRRDG